MPSQYTKQTRSTCVISPPRNPPKGKFGVFPVRTEQRMLSWPWWLSSETEGPPQQIQISEFILNWQCVSVKKLQFLTFKTYRSTNEKNH